MMRPLNARQQAFIVEYPVDFNGAQAAIRAGYSPESANQAAFALLTNPQVAAAIEERKAELAARAGLSTEWVLRRWKEIADADPNELISIVLESCRHCYGENHEFQWTDFEYRQAERAAAAHRCTSKCEPGCLKNIPPPNAGGFGFDPRRAPNPECPVCQGNGMEKIRLADTTKLKGPARRLYAGVKQTQHGIEIKMRDQDAALMNIAKFLGMLIEKRELSGPGGAAIPLAHYTAQDLTDDQLATIISGEFNAKPVDALPASV